MQSPQNRVSVKSGGEIIGQGSYGCVFNPPLVCKGKKYIRTIGELGKLTTIEDVEDELKTASILRNRPLTANYFIIPEASLCEIEIAEQTEPDIDKCNVLKKIASNNLRQIKMKYGGVDLSHYLKTLVQNEKFDYINFMKHMLEAGLFMLLAGIVHHDIHKGNILIDNKEVSRIIDWGYSFYAPTITLKEIREIPAWAYISTRQTNTEPPEVTLASCLDSKLSLHYAKEYILLGKPIIKDSFISPDVHKKELDDFIEMSASFKDKDWQTMFRTHWNTFDSWTLGCLFLTLLRQLQNSQKFIDEQYKANSQNRKKINEVIKSMIHMNPFIRYDCIEALEILDPTNSILQKYGKEWLEKRKRERIATVANINSSD